MATATIKVSFSLSPGIGAENLPPPINMEKVVKIKPVRRLAKSGKDYRKETSE